MPIDWKGWFYPEISPNMAIFRHKILLPVYKKNDIFTNIDSKLVPIDLEGWFYPEMSPNMAIFIRSFHFIWKASCYSYDYFYYSFFRQLFTSKLWKKLTTYHNETSYMISVTQNLFGLNPDWQNPFPLRSNLPEHRKPCVRFSSWTVKDIDLKSFANC